MFGRNNSRRSSSSVKGSIKGLGLRKRGSRGSRGSSLGESIDETPEDLEIETFTPHSNQKFGAFKKIKSPLQRASTIGFKSKSPSKSASKIKIGSSPSLKLRTEQS